MSVAQETTVLRHAQTLSEVTHVLASVVTSLMLINLNAVVSIWQVINSFICLKVAFLIKFAACLSAKKDFSLLDMQDIPLSLWYYGHFTILCEFQHKTFGTTVGKSFVFLLTTTYIAHCDIDINFVNDFF